MIDNQTLFSTIVLKNDKYSSDRLKTGDQGIIVDFYADGAFEVDFSDDEGITIGVIAVQPEDIEIIRSPT